MKRIKVAFFAEILQEELDGATRTMFQLINRIDKHRFEFLFICGLGPNQLHGFECFKIPTITLPVNSGYSMALPGLAHKKLKHKLETFSAHVVHIATPSLLGSFAANYATQHGLPIISIYHTHFISYIDYYLKHLPYLIKPAKFLTASGQRAFYNNCDKIYVPAESIKAELIDLGVETHRMMIWKRGIDGALFSPKKRDTRLLNKMMGNTYPTIIFASRLVWEKNLETLIAIYNRAQKLKLKVNFLIVGDGVAKSACAERMPDAVFTGKVDHQLLSVLYPSSDIFLFPSVSETYGNVVVEAMASGLPCVVADGGGARDFITQGENGFKCIPNNAADYIRKIKMLLNSPALAQQFAKEGINFSSGFKWEHLAEIYFNDLHQMAQPVIAQYQQL